MLSISILEWNSFFDEVISIFMTEILILDQKLASDHFHSSCMQNYLTTFFYLQTHIQCNG